MDSAEGIASDLEQVYRQHADRLWRALVLATGSPDVAGDAVAEAFAQALRRGTQIRDPSRWVWRAAFRLAAGELKERARFSPLRDDLPAAAPESLLDVIAALRTLTLHQRMAVVLADYAGYPHREIAGMLGSTVGAVAVHVHRGRRRLKELLGGPDA